jgi:hypothetical protein
MKPWLKSGTLSVATLLWTSFAASAATLPFNFSFTVPGASGYTVMGTLTVDTVAGDATSVVVTNNTAGFGTGQYLPTGFLFTNSFTVSGGTITAYSFQVDGGFNVSPAVTCCTLTMFSSPVGAGLSDLPTTTGTVAGVSVAFTPPVSSVPLPATLPLFASGLGALGLLGWRRKKKAIAA